MGLFYYQESSKLEENKDSYYRIMNISGIKKLNIPKTPGCYKFLNKKKKIIYIGKAADLRTRVFSYWRKSTNHTPAKYSMLKQVASVDRVEVESEIEALLLESNLIKKYQPQYNIDLRDDKRFLYIKVSTEDEIPGVFATRKISKSGRYFGPYTSAQAVKQTLKAIRKIWPYCLERKIKKKSCFYYQINRCTGVCGKLFDLKDYREKIIKPIILFLSGKKSRIVSGLERERKQAKKEGREEEAKRIFFVLKNMKQVLAHATVISVSEKYAADVIELAKILRLKKIPTRIEGYDISNIFGQEAVGSMVVFKEGEPDKKEYRKFKIKISEGMANDTRMFKEILERRFNNNWELPGLIIVDGGKAQLNAAIKVIKKNKFDIPVISVSKGIGLRSAAAPDKIFFPGEKKPLELPLASPALHIIKRVRDEAHRFAIKYHRQLRGKKFLN